MKHSMTVILLLALGMGLVACKQGQDALEKTIQDAASSQQKIDLTGIPPERMILTPEDQSLSAGEVIQLRATGVYTKDYSQIITSNSLVWTSDDPTVFKVEADGTGKGLVEGQVTITASYLGVTSSLLVRVTPPTVSQLLMLTQSLDVELHLIRGQLQPQNISFEVYALKTDGQLLKVTDEVNWQIDENEGMKSIIDEPGRYSIQTTGTWNVKVDFAGVETVRTVHVAAEKKVLRSIRPSLNPLVLRIGQTLELDAIGLYNDETESILSQDWTLSPASDLIAISGKSITGLKVGTTQLALSSNDFQSNLVLYVQDPGLTSISVIPGSFTLRQGESASFTVSANYGDGSSADISSAISAITTNAGVVTLESETRRIQAIAQGSANLRVSYRGLTTTALVAVDSPVLSRLEVRPSALSVVAGRTVPYQVIGIYSNGNEADITTLVSAQALSTSRAEVPTGQAGQLVGKTAGSTILSATYVDPLTLRNLTGTAPVTIAPPELLFLTFDNASTSIPLGRTFDFGIQGSYSDGTQIDVGSLVQITADVSSAGMNYVGSIIRTGSNRIRVQSLAQGTMKIIAALAGQSAVATITVTEKQLDVVQIKRQTPFSNPGFLLKGDSADFTAIATFSDNSTTDVTNTVGIYTVTWSPPANASVASFVDSSGKKRMTGLSDGDAQISVTVTSSQGTASISYGIGVYIPCSGTGQYYGYQCWFLGASGASCDSTCSGVTRATHSATLTDAGSQASTSNQCSNILGSLFRSSMNSFNSAATAAQGIGCSIFTGSGLNLGLREVSNPTTGSASLANFRRVCSCE